MFFARARFRSALCLVALFVGSIASVDAAAAEMKVFDADHGFVTIPTYFQIFRNRLAAAATPQAKEELRWLFRERVRLLMVELASFENQLGFSAAESVLDALISSAATQLPIGFNERVQRLEAQARAMMAKAAPEESVTPAAAPFDIELLDFVGIANLHFIRQRQALAQQPLHVPKEYPKTDRRLTIDIDSLQTFARELASLGAASEDAEWKLLAEEVNHYLDYGRYRDAGLVKLVDRKEQQLRLYVAFAARCDPSVLRWAWQFLQQEDLEARQQADPQEAQEEKAAYARAIRIATTSEGALGKARLERDQCVAMARMLGLRPVGMATGASVTLDDYRKQTKHLLTDLARYYDALPPRLRERWDALAKARFSYWERRAARQSRADAPWSESRYEAEPRRLASIAKGMLRLGFGLGIHALGTAFTFGISWGGVIGLKAVAPAVVDRLAEPLLIGMLLVSPVGGYLFKRFALNEDPSIPADEPATLSYRVACGEIIAGVTGWRRRR